MTMTSSSKTLSSSGGALLKPVHFNEPLPSFVRIINLREEWNEELLHHFYENCMKKYFPIEDELDPIEVWIGNMHPDNRQNPSQKLLPDMHICIAFDMRYKEETNPRIPRIIAATVFEYYKLSNCALLSYFMVNELYRESGVGKYMTLSAFHEIKTNIANHYSQLEKSRWQNGEMEEWETQLLNGTFQSDKNKLEYFEQARLCKEKRRRNKDGHERDFSVFFAETNAWGVHDGVMDASKRHNIMRRIGYRMVDFDYIQPPLSEEQEPCVDLLLLVLDVPELPIDAAKENRKYIDSDLVKMFMLEFGYSVFEDFEFVPEDYFQHMMNDLILRGSRLYLSNESDIPWTRRTNFALASNKSEEANEERPMLASKL